MTFIILSITEPVHPGEGFGLARVVSVPHPVPPEFDYGVECLGHVLFWPLVMCVQGILYLEKVLHITNHLLEFSTVTFLPVDLSHQIIAHLGLVGSLLCPSIALEFQVIYKFTIECGPPNIIDLHLPTASQEASEALLASSSPIPLWFQVVLPVLHYPEKRITRRWAAQWVTSYRLLEVAPLPSSHPGPSSWLLPLPLNLCY